MGTERGERVISQGVPPLTKRRQTRVGGKTSYVRANVAAIPSEYRGTSLGACHRGIGLLMLKWGPLMTDYQVRGG